MNAAMKLMLLAIVLSISSLARAADSPRQVIDLNSGWKFIREDVVNAEQAALDDSKWQSIDLPHTWNNLDGQDGGNNYYRGTGWYRLHLKYDPAWKGKALYLKFDAASIDATVYVNGKEAGKHAGSFGAFCFDITPLMDRKGDNLIAVKVSNARDDNVAPLSADFTFFGGIYRGVHLLVLNPLSISPVDDASSGIYIRQRKVDSNYADLMLTTEIRNIKSEDATLTYEKFDASGTSVGGKITVELGKNQSSYSMGFGLDHPHLWNGRKDPYMYTLRVTLLSNKTVTDVVEQPFGIRFFRVDPDKGFFLNGQPYRLYGVNRHQDHLDEGWAISLADHQLDFANMMEMGCTAVRLSHYQHAQEFYDLCDKGGMVAWAEIPIVNRVNVTDEFDDNASQQLRELIKQSYNHPSICFWSLSNELGNNGLKGKELDEERKHQIVLQTRLNAEAHQLDSTRLTTEANLTGLGKPLDQITDVFAINRYYGWYNGTPDQLAPELDKAHKVYPNRSVGISEYGAGASIFQHEANVKQPKPSGKWHPEEWQCIVHEQAWAAIKARPWIWGSFLWAEHDFASDYRNEGDHPGRNDKGLVTYDGKTKKDAFYFYKANWSTEPVIYITERRFTPRPVADAPVKIYSNCDSVELSVNGKSLGSTAGSDVKVFLFDKVQLQPGENKLIATGTRDGKTYTDSCTIVFDEKATDGHAPATQPKK
jgi:beta-galactosidase